MRTGRLVFTAKVIVALLLAAASGAVLRAQPLTTPVSVAPDCLIFYDFSANASSAAFDNRFIGCKTWYVAYTNTGFPALTLTFEDAPDNGGVPGAYVAFAGTIVEGVNPNVALTQASSIFYGYYPWVRLTLSGAVAGAGRRIRGTFYGYRQEPVISALFVGAPNVNLAQVAGTNTVTAGLAGLLAVGGPNADSSPPTARPVLTAGWDLTNVQTLQLTDTGMQIVANAVVPADGRDNAAAVLNLSKPEDVYDSLPLEVFPFIFNGTAGKWDRELSCNSRAAITIAGAGNTQIVAASGATSIRVCHLSLAMSGQTNITVIEGTGVACATGPANITGAYLNILGLALDLGDRNRVATAASQALCITNSAAVTGGGFVTYAQY